MSLTIAFNHTSTDQAYPTGTWVTVNTGSDFLVFTKGDPLVADGQAIPSSFQLSSAGMFLNGTTQVVPHYLVANISGNILNEVFLAGPQNKRYAFACIFSGATTSEPVLEVWDNSGLNTINAVSLGSGTPANSWFRGITTTAGLPGVSWSGSPLAGSSDGNFLWLNNLNGALSGARVLYFNLQMVIPSSQTQGGVEAPVICVKYTTT